MVRIRSSKSIVAPASARDLPPFFYLSDPVVHPEIGTGRDPRGELLVGLPQEELVPERDLGPVVDHEGGKAGKGLEEGGALDYGHDAEVERLPGAVAVEAVARRREGEGVAVQPLAVGAAHRPARPVREGRG